MVRFNDFNDVLVRGVVVRRHKVAGPDVHPVQSAVFVAALALKLFVPLGLHHRRRAGRVHLLQ